MKNNAMYKNIKDVDNNTVKYLWEILESFNQFERSSFLFFVTGSSKPPLDGFKNFRI
jgi:ubiquitin-protein ligase E3 C